MANILVTGGAGYVGAVLVPELIRDGHTVRVYDRCWFGIHDSGAPVWCCDIRQAHIFESACDGIDTVIHLACISNDASFKLDEKLSTSINFDAFEPLVIAAKRAGVKRFIYASSSSVYGVSSASEVTEDQPLVPVSLYNRYKALCEPLLFKHESEDFTCVAIRPATLCGPSQRMRFDLMVNSLTNQAVRNGEIMVRGGSQYRSNLHINDMVRAYKRLVCAPAEKVAGQVFNCGQSNMTIAEIADLVCYTVWGETGKRPVVSISSSTDKRSYRINSSKIARELDFHPMFTVEQAVRDLCLRFMAGEWQDSMTNPVYTNLDQYFESSVA